MTFKYKHNQNNFSFYFLNQSGNKIPISNWEELQLEFLSQLAILNELQDNGLADCTEYSCEVDSLEIVKLSDIDKQILDLPDHYPYEIFIESNGWVYKTLREYNSVDKNLIYFGKKKYVLSN